MTFESTFIGWVFFFVHFALAYLIAHGLYKAHKHRTLIHWSARHYDPLFVAIIWTILFLTVESNLQIMGSLMDLLNLSYQGHWILHNIFTLGFLGIYALRVWLVHYDYHTGVAMYVQVTNIGLSMEEIEHFQWFLVNKDTYGSPRYLQRFVGILVVVLVIALWGWSAVSPTSYAYGAFCFYIAIFAVLMSITKKITILDDEFYIRTELLKEFRVLAGALFVLGWLIMFGSVMGWRWFTFLAQETIVFCIAAMGIIATWWIYEKSELFTLPLLLAEKKKQDSVRNGATENDPLRASGVPPISRVLSNRQALALFLKHLVRELSAENIFFLADVMQYKKAFVEHKKLDDIPGFYVPMEPLLARYVWVRERSFGQYAASISKNYVDDLTAFYVTALHDDTREQILYRLHRIVENDEETMAADDWRKLATLFDDAAEEIHVLLKQAYQRFAVTKDFGGITFNDRTRALTSEVATVLKKRQQSTNADATPGGPTPAAANDTTQVTPGEDDANGSTIV